MRKFRYLLFVTAVLIFSCNKPDNNDNVKTNDVFIAGYKFNWNPPEPMINVPTLWKNSVAERLSDNGMALSVYCSDGDVYVAGYTGPDIDPRATIWKNGTATILSDQYSEAHSVFVLNDDVYVAGFAGEDHSKAIAILWKNGSANILSDLYSIAYSVFVSGDEYYVAGGDNYQGGLFQAALWDKNGKTILSDNISVARSVFVANGVVYVAGRDYDGEHSLATLWRNGSVKILSGERSYANSVYVSGNDVWVAGILVTGTSPDEALLWKNDTLQDFVTGHQFSPSSLCISEDKVFVAGNNGNGSEIYLNGVYTDLQEGPSSHDTIYHAAEIFVQ